VSLRGNRAEEHRDAGPVKPNRSNGLPKRPFVRNCLLAQSLDRLPKARINDPNPWADTGAARRIRC